MSDAMSKEDRALWLRRQAVAITNIQAAVPFLDDANLTVDTAQLIAIYTKLSAYGRRVMLAQAGAMARLESTKS